MKKYLLSLLVFISLTSCSVSPIAPVVEEITFPSNGTTGNSNTANGFASQLKSYGINLTFDDIEVLRKYQSVIPNGKWYAPEGTTEAENLGNNFITLNRTFKDFPLSNVQDYLNRAIQFAGSGNFYAKKYFDIEYYRLRQKILVIKSDPQTSEFVIIHTDGSLSNYQISQNVGLPRYILIPENL